MPTLRTMPSSPPRPSVASSIIRLTSSSRAMLDHAVMSGDVIHHPIQCAAPWLSNAADFDCETALATRVKLLEQLADTPSILLAAHFPAPTAGRVISSGAAFRFDFH
jgi:hypothetical protein